MRVFIIAIALTIVSAISEEQHHHHHQHEGHHHNQHHQSHHDHFHEHQHHTHHDQSSSHSQPAIDAQQQDLFLSSPNQTPQDKILQFFSNCQKQIDEWVYIPQSKSLQQLLHDCQAFTHSQYLLHFYRSLRYLSTDFSKQHIDLMIKQFKTVRIVPQVLTCIVDKREIENHYLDERKKYKYLAQFINKYPQQAKDAFPKQASYAQAAQKTCHFFKALFQYYYLEVLRPSGTLSTEFLRALTVRSDVFEHEDIAFCIEIESVGKLSGELEDIDINNVYLKLPEVFHALRFLKLKPECRDAHHRRLVNRLHTALDGLDMFKIMYKDYQPFVEIATEKMVQTQIRLLARKFAHIIQNRVKYLEYSKMALDPQL